LQPSDGRVRVFCSTRINVSQAALHVFKQQQLDALALQAVVVV
jgi:hypothetical protein